MKKIFILAADHSAEKYGVELVSYFKKNSPDIEFFGAGGEQFREAGVELLAHSRDLTIVGIVEVVFHLLKLKRYLNIFVKEAKLRKCDAALLIDFPDFNLRLAKKFKKLGIPVYYYISPTIWAWRYSRVEQIRKYVDHLFVIFPFEVELYRKEKIPFTYTGHPLLKSIRVIESLPSFRDKVGIKKDEYMLTLLPGSRKSEVNSLLPVMLESVKILQQKYKIRIFILKSDSIERIEIKKYLSGEWKETKIVSQKEGYNLIADSDAVLGTCGTSNLETAVLGTPFVAVYRVNRLSYFLGKRFLKIENYSIVNILLGKRLVDELIQKDFNPGSVSRAVEDILVNKKRITEMKKEFLKIKEMLSQPKNPVEIIYNRINSDLMKEI